jgi:2-dehydropantoate 2-reductase
MKIAVIGAGAIGGWIAAKLALTGANDEISVIARGETLTTIRKHGLRLRSTNESGEHDVIVKLTATDDATTLGAQDLIVIAVKAPALANALPQIAPLIEPHTTVLSAMNGVPAWFFARTDRPLSGYQLQSIDPSAQIARALPAKQVVGCVVHAACSIDAPGIIRHKFGNKLILGEATGGESARLMALAARLNAAQFEATLSLDIQRDIWFKLWGNMTMNPVSAITGATGDKILSDPLVRNFCTAVMLEAKAIGAKIGIDIPDTPEQRHAVTEKLGAFKTSMLQDLESKKAIELDALVAAVSEIGNKVGVATPYIDALLGLTRLMAQTRGLY